MRRRRPSKTRRAEAGGVSPHDGGRPGQLPLLGDDDGGQLFGFGGGAGGRCRGQPRRSGGLLDDPSLAVSPASDETCVDSRTPGRRRAAHGPRERRGRRALLPDSGYFVSRMAGRRSSRLRRRAARLPQRRPCACRRPVGRAHGRRRTDAHRSRYRPPIRWTRRRAIDFRSSRMHNTLVLDGREHAVPHGAFHWRSRTNARFLVARAGRGTRFRRRHARRLRPDAPHAGRPDAARHRLADRRSRHRQTGRRWRTSAGIFIQPGREHWRLDRGASSTSRVAAAGAAPPRRRTSRRRQDPALSAYAPEYGRIEPSTTLVARHAAAAPFVVGHIRAGRRRCRRRRGDRRGGRGACSARLDHCRLRHSDRRPRDLDISVAISRSGLKLSRLNSGLSRASCGSTCRGTTTSHLTNRSWLSRERAPASEPRDRSEPAKRRARERVRGSGDEVPRRKLAHVRHRGIRGRRVRRQGGPGAGTTRRRVQSRASDVRRHPASRPGRRRHSRGAGARPRDAPPDHHRSRGRPPADSQRDEHDLGRLQRRDLQLSRAARGARVRRPPVLHLQRYRDDRPRVRAVGRGCLPPPARHVRHRACGTSRHRTLLLARDRAGQKPLHYAERGGRLYFGSEIKSLLAAGAVDPALNLAALDHYLAFLYTPRDASIFEGVRKLPPGHVLRWRDGRAEVRQYWQVGARETFAGSEAEAVQALSDVLQDAVRSHMVSDVPLGAFLSGGVDSSAIVGMMARASSRPVQDVLDRLRRPRVRRARTCAHGGAALRHGSPRVRRPPRRTVDPRRHDRALRRAVRRLLRHPDVVRLGDRAAARHGRPVG